MVACRRYGCGRSAPEAAARLRFKTCHNCAHTYCSRECRREHWDAHKRACAVQRVAGLLRRVVARVRADTAAVSLAARRGYKAHGRGVVRVLFHSTDAAEAYCAGRADLTDASGHCGAASPTLASLEMAFVRWDDLPAGELGGSLHQDLTRLCNTYNPRTRAVTLVVLEVLSEAPSDDGVVMWERQLVSRVFKVHLFREATFVLKGAAVGAPSAVLDNVTRALQQRGVELDDDDSEWRRVQDHVLAGSASANGPLSVDLHLHEGGRVLVLLVAGAEIRDMGAVADDVELVDVAALEALDPEP